MKIKTICCAPDSFKESMRASLACDAMEKGIHAYDPSIKVIKVPMADGGEGTLDALVEATDGKIYTHIVKDPLGNDIQARFGLLGHQKTAVIEMAEASGLELVPLDKRNPLFTSSYGTGQLIKACLDYRVEKILIGIGGSATNDGGTGMLEALGVKFYDQNHQEIHMNGMNLQFIEHIDISHLDKRLKKLQSDIACDVDNTLCGPQGASAIYGPQKGATPLMVEQLDTYLMHLAKIIKKDLNIDVLDLKGGGAAGGLGVALSAFLKGTLKRGIDCVIETAMLEEKLNEVDLIFTGEGKMDSQTQFGKTPMGVLLCGQKKHIPVIGFTGIKGQSYEVLLEKGFKDIIQITPEHTELSVALKEGPLNLKESVYAYLKAGD